MRAVVQRVRQASVRIADAVRAEIGPGLLVLVAIAENDTTADGEWLAGKIVRMRIFADAAGRMNRAVTEINGEILVISQFTLFAETRKGNRPSFTRSAPAAIAIPLYDQFKFALSRQLGRPVATGEFGAEMQVSLVNDGPVTIIIDSRTKE